MQRALQRFRSDESGAEIIEWAVVTVILLVATVPAILALQDELLNLFTSVFKALEAPPPDQY
jgi:Flp pilus assembly pilin Flp